MVSVMSDYVSPAPMALGAVRRISSVEEAEGVSAFLLQEGLFGTPPTPGERELFRNHPAQAVGDAFDSYWQVVDAQGAVCGVIGVRRQAMGTGLYEVTAFAVSSTVRGRGIGHHLLERTLNHVSEVGGRGLLVDTSAAPSYAPMRHLLEELGFDPVGRFPDFYYPGEDALWYYHPIAR